MIFYKIIIENKVDKPVRILYMLGWTYNFWNEGY